ncbi:uncharacterized protein LOC115327191, partial [Ixodes scapularis]|uniref:uncharacterized protein LOC115327191 n=1 Tax=Ixodes scapularis TaxID=6945 RepID=UPI001C381F58
VTMINITVYLLFTPSRFTPDTLQAYKSLEAYNYFESGHVRDVRLWQPDRHELCFVRANVKPSQRATGPPHDAWVCLDHKTGQVYCGHCTCKAGLGEVCSHVAALLFCVEYTARVSQEDSCTSQPCAWTRTVARKEDMVPVHQLDLSKPGMPSRTPPEEPNHVSGDFQLADKAFFEEIHRLNPQAVVLRSIRKMDDEDTDSASEDEQSYTFLRKVRRTRSTRMSLPQDMFVPMREIERIEKSTRRQATTLMWREVRYGRITASIINKVRTMRDTTSPKAILDLVLLRTPPLTTEAICWGVEKEPEAKETYQKFMETCHSDFRLCSVGFVIDKKVVPAAIILLFVFECARTDKACTTFLIYILISWYQ